MVYCGKPSMGCRTCRARRIKCDETRPVCNQCTKSRRHCSGYRSDFDILHRDETQATANRAKKAAAKKAAKRAAENGEVLIQFDSSTPTTPPSSSSLTFQSYTRQQPPPEKTSISSSSSSASSSSGSSPDWSVSLISPTTTAATSTTNHSPLEFTFPVAAPALPLDQHASHYFAAHFIMVPGQNRSRMGHLHYLVPLLRSETDTNSPFQLAYSACGFAAMSNREKSNHLDLASLAYEQQLKAVRSVAQALQDPAHARTDATLAAVLLLSFFEKITATKETGLLAWRTHVEGAIHILKERGAEQFQNKDKYSSALFTAVRHQIIARTLSSGTAPCMGVNWWLRETEHADPVGTRSQRFALEISDLRAEVTRLMAGLPRNERGLEFMLEMLRKIQDLDRQIANWLNTLPPEYQYHSLYWEDGSSAAASASARDASVFPGRVDVYHDLVTACVWNAIRASRIILESILIRVAAWICSPADYRSTPEYTTAVRTIKTNIADILSSIPFLLNQTGGDKEGAVNGGSFVCGSDEQSKMVGGLFVSWPLSTVRTCDFTTDEQREYAAGRLNYIAQGLGIRYASTLAEAKIRFPSMLIRRDGLMTTQDPLKDMKQTIAIRAR